MLDSGWSGVFTVVMRECTGLGLPRFAPQQTSHAALHAVDRQHVPCGDGGLAVRDADKLARLSQDPDNKHAAVTQLDFCQSTAVPRVVRVDLRMRNHVPVSGVQHRVAVNPTPKKHEIA